MPTCPCRATVCTLHVYCIFRTHNPCWLPSWRKPDDSWCFGGLKSRSNPRPTLCKKQIKKKFDDPLVLSFTIIALSHGGHLSFLARCLTPRASASTANPFTSPGTRRWSGTSYGYGNFDIIFGPFIAYSRAPTHPPTHPILPVCRGLLVAHADWELTGAWNPML